MRRIAPSFREKVWGSTALEPWFPASREKIGEVWFETDPPSPILIKFLFASEKLSVQVHPAGPAGIGKTEMWHILRAAPGAAIAAGFREPVTRERMREAAAAGQIERLLRWMEVRAGETYFIPAGTVHAIGGGVALCEIQQNSDITYRLYDYGRPRELHVEEAVRVAGGGVYGGAPAERQAGGGWHQLVSCEHFTTQILRERREAAELPAAPGPQFVIGLDGAARVGEAEVKQGEVWIATAGDPLPIQPLGAVTLLRVDGGYRAASVSERLRSPEPLS